MKITLVLLTLIYSINAVIEEVDFDKYYFTNDDDKQIFKSEINQIQKSERFNPFVPTSIDKLDIYARNISTLVT